MKEIEIDVRISGNVAEYDLNQTGLFGGSYQGLFKFRTVLTPMQEIQADRDYRALVGENGKDASVKILNLCYILAQLKQRIIESPPFWSDGSSFSGSQIKDKEILEHLFQVSIKAEEQYKKLLLDKQIEATQRLKKHLEKEKENSDINEELS